MRKLTYLIFASFILLSLIFLSMFHLPFWDESVYVGMGKYLFSAGQSGLWESIRPIGLPIISGILWFMGLPVLFTTRLIVTLFGLGCVWIVYKSSESDNVRIFAPFFLLSIIFFEFSSFVMTEIPAAFFGLLCFYFMLNNKLNRSAFFAGVAFWFKFPMGLLFFPILLAAYQKRKFSSLIYYFIPIIVYLLFNLIFYGSLDFVFEPFIQAASHQSNPAESLSHKGFNLPEILYYPIKLFSQNILYFFLIPGIFYVLKNRIKNYYPLLLYLILFFAYLSIIVNKQERFLLLVYPAIVLISIAGFSLIHNKNKWVTYILIFMTVIIFALSFPSLSFSQTKEVALYKYFEDKPGVVLTSDPIFSVYSDNIFIPYYMDSNKGLEIIQNTNYDFLVFSENNFYCDKVDCDSNLELIRSIVFKNKPIFNDTFYYDSSRYYILESKN